ncbi:MULTISPECIES: hypothetical protein [unclassified Streptomyces]|uniref:hypothetical protein n=1 Tax=unclassified Streptomyces TaxID=2593676 RepID=UPI000DAC23C7|nr:MULTISPECIES: hypothetical protein [unclassified Streptomyces]PZT76351.1 hypothetical protein DNK56_23695 [Streptomyces sp. AC1-42W]PZT79695.1 hypothetical protein DNK55_08990 [Streptomyces sp. AC1-42T]
MLNFVAAVILVALVAPVVLVGRGLGLWRRGSRWAAGLLFSAGGSIVVYAVGLLWFVAFVDFAKGCGHEAVRPPRNADWFEEGSFPLTATCHWDGGGTYSFVPAFVNPLIYACIAFTLLCAVMAVREHRGSGHTS